MHFQSQIDICIRQKQTSILNTSKETKNLKFHTHTHKLKILQEKLKISLNKILNSLKKNISILKLLKKRKASL